MPAHETNLSKYKGSFITVFKGAVSSLCWQAF